MSWFSRIFRRQAPRLQNRQDEASPLDPRLPTRPGSVRLSSMHLHARNEETIIRVADALRRQATSVGVLQGLQQGGSNRFVVGYLAGVVDAICQDGGVTNEGQRLAMVERLYAEIFVEGVESAAIDHLLKGQVSDREMRRGVQAGGEDMFDLIDGEGKAYVHLLNHLAAGGGLPRKPRHE